MPEITLRSLDAAVLASLERRAAANGRMVADEVVAILEQVTAAERDGLAERLRRAMADRRPKDREAFSDSTALLSALRDGAVLGGTEGRAHG